MFPGYQFLEMKNMILKPIIDNEPDIEIIKLNISS